ncbi:MAG: hypothetical protein ABSG52_14485 [Terriglobales bacterium]|jgi:hypothetical protein
MAVAPKPLEFSAEEISAIRRVIAHEIERGRELKAAMERRNAAAAKDEAAQAETERMQRAAREIKIGHNAVRDGLGCICADCMKERNPRAPVTFRGEIW